MIERAIDPEVSTSSISDKTSLVNSSCIKDEERHKIAPILQKSEAEKRFVRKLNIRLLPFAIVIVFLQVLITPIIIKYSTIIT
jgi:hypothetical protein